MSNGHIKFHLPVTDGKKIPIKMVNVVVISA